MAVLSLVALGAASCGADGPTASDQEATPRTMVTTTGVTAPPRPQPAVPTADQPMRLLLLGDGLMWDSAPAMTAAAAAIGPSVVEDQAYWGFALSRPEWRDWRALWPQYVAAFQPTVVAVSFGIHDTEPQTPDGVPVDPADVASWADWYAQQVHRAMDDLTSGGAIVYWLGLPPVGDPVVNQRVAALNQVTRNAVEVDPRGRFVDTSAAFAGPDGNAAPTTADGVPLRKYDLLHMCAAGAAVMADLFATAVSADMGVVVDPAYLNAPWRTDPRYAQDGPPGCRSASVAP